MSATSRLFAGTAGAFSGVVWLLACSGDPTASDGSASGGTGSTSGGVDADLDGDPDASGRDVASTSPDVLDPPEDFGKALRFMGNGTNDVDRVKIRVDQPGQTGAPWPMDVGATDFTLEWWMRGTQAENPAAPIACGDNIAWINGNIIVDRDRYNRDRKFGVAIGAGRVAFGVSGDGTGDRTICGTRVVLDDRWHHVAIERRRSDGHLWIFVDGALDVDADGPDGDVSYPDGVQPGSFCGGLPCAGSDPFLVIGAEKHDADAALYPPFRGAFDEFRASRVLRYVAPTFPRPTRPFAADADTVGLYHFDEGQGAIAADSSGAMGGPSPGVVSIGGAPVGPTWVDGPSR